MFREVVLEGGRVSFRPRGWSCYPPALLFPWSLESEGSAAAWTNGRAVVRMGRWDGAGGSGTGSAGQVVVWPSPPDFRRADTGTPPVPLPAVIRSLLDR